jgi:hypothetical protein
VIEDKEMESDSELFDKLQTQEQICVKEILFARSVGDF